MKALSMIGQNERGETKYERPIVVGKRDVLIIQMPSDVTSEYAQQAMDRITAVVNGQFGESETPVLILPDTFKIRVLRIDN